MKQSKLNTFLLLLLSSCLLLSVEAIGQTAAETTASVRPRNRSLALELQRSIDRGTDWLRTHQDPKGFWSTTDHPAITAMALVALLGNQEAEGTPALDGTAKRGYEFILGFVKPDGGIYGEKGYANYNTAVSMMGLLAARQRDYKPVILKARQFLIGTQIDMGEPGRIDSEFDGGIGYGSSYDHSDMGNTVFALEALHYSRQLARDEPASGAKDLNWEAAIHFLQNCQNLTAYNKQPWASDDPPNQGGFIYYPGSSKAGEMNLPSGRVALRSYGSISYGGLLSYAYARMGKADPRVQAVLDWLRGNYTLEENPGMGLQGLYFYFHTMTKALNIHDVDVLETDDGRNVNWREELALKLMNLQQPDGSWVNTNARWWENDPALVTSYVVIALKMIQNRL